MPPLDSFLRLLLATGLGAAIGLGARVTEGSLPGCATNILIALGSRAVHHHLAIAGLDGDRRDTGSGRRADRHREWDSWAAVRSSGSGITIKGMTTAATIWVNAAIGMAAGSGHYALATMATVMTLMVLAVLPPIEAFFERRAGRDDLINH